MKNYANFVTEKTGQALEPLPSITGEHTSSLFTLGPDIPLPSIESQKRFTVSL
jgi:hypothetical protein